MSFSSRKDRLTLVSQDNGPRNQRISQVYHDHWQELVAYVKRMVGYGPPDPEDVVQTAFTRHYRATLSEHLKQISRPGGLFKDTAVTGSRWQGQMRKVRAVLYQRIKPGSKPPSTLEMEEAINDVATKWIAALASAGIKATRGNGEDFYAWLLKWFNPSPSFAQENPNSYWHWPLIPAIKTCLMAMTLPSN